MKKLLLAACLLLCTVLLVACGQSPRRTSSTPSLRGEAPRVELLASHEKSAESFTVSHAFSSDMVIQRDERIRVWGWADESRNGETVTVTFKGTSAEGTIADGEWLVTFSEGFSASAESGHAMTVICGADTVTFDNVLVGDVYMVIGQSNVAYSMEAHCAAKGKSVNLFADADAPIRLFYNTLNDTAGYPMRGTDVVCEDVLNGRTWWTPTAEHIRPFTALGYLFAQGIVEKTEGKIPVGIIEIDGNGQPIGSFMSNQAAGEADSDTLRQNTGLFTTPGVNGNEARYMYNHYMAPYEKYALAGLVWYQGESDCEQSNANRFADKFVALMEYMRSTHNVDKPNFPVYIVEIPTIYQKPADFTGAWHYMDLGYIRAEMGSIPQRLLNSYMAVSSDIFTDNRYFNSLHPNIKDAQAERLADLAGSVWYGLAPLEVATGPVLKDYAVSEDRKTVTLTFDHVGEGLATSDGGKQVLGFAAFNRIGGLLDGAALQATITGKDQITITSDKSMYGVAYNCVSENFYGKEINLCNSNGKIAAAFTFSELRMYGVRHEILGEESGTLAPTATDAYAIYFRAPAELVSVGTQIHKKIVNGGTVNLSLYAFKTDYATSVAVSPIATETRTDIDPYGWLELAAGRNRTWDAGEYLLVISDAEDVWLMSGASHEGQYCYRNGEYLADTSLMLALTYNTKVETPYAAPSTPPAGAETTAPETVPESLTESIPDTAAPDTTLTDTDPAESETAMETADVTAPVDDAGCGSAAKGTLALLALLSAAAYMLTRRERKGA